MLIQNQNNYISFQKFKLVGLSLKSETSEKNFFIIIHFKKPGHYDTKTDQLKQTFNNSYK